MIAGRLEVGGSKFKLNADTSVLKMLETDEKKLAFLTHTANAARAALMKIERIVQKSAIMERMDRDDLRRMGEPDRERTGGSVGRGTAGDSAGDAAERSDSLDADSERRSTGLEKHTADRGEDQHGLVSDVQSEVRSESGDLVQVRSAVRDVQAEFDGTGSLDGGRTDRELRHEMDALHGGAASASGDDSAIPQSVPDSSSLGGQESVGLQGTAGQTVRASESQTGGGVREDSGMGENEGILHGRNGDEGDRISTGDDSVTDKLNSVFAAAETEEPSPEPEDGFDFAETAELPDEERLKILTAEIGRKTQQFTACVTAGEYEKTPEIMEEINELTRIAAELKETIRTKPLTADDIHALRSIQPPKISVSNFREEDVASTPKFEDTFNRTLGEKSPYQRTGYSPRSRDEQEVPIIDVQSRKCSFSSVKKDISSEVIARGRSAEGGLVVTNADTGWTVQISRVGLEDSVSYAKQFRDDDTYQALYSIEDLIRNAVLLDTTVSARNKNNKSKDTLFMHRLYAPMRIGSEFSVAKITIEELGNEHIDTIRRFYNLGSIKIEPLANISLAEDQLHLAVPNDSVISIADLTAFVKAYDKDFFENPNAIGRDAREAELYTQAEYQDALTAFESGAEIIPNAANAQLELFADARNMTIEDAEPAMEKLVAAYIEEVEEEQAAADAAFEEKVHAAFAEIRQNHTNLNESQRRCLKYLEKFAIDHQVHENLVTEALNPEVGSSFAARYGSRTALSKMFAHHWNAIEQELDAALAKQFVPAVQQEEVDTYINSEETTDTMPFSNKISNGADDESDPMVYDGSMNPQDAQNVAERVLANESENTFEIYQLKHSEENRDIRFEGIDFLEQRGYAVDFDNYDLIYSGKLAENTTLEDLFYRFNEERPADFTGHSMSVSDVVVFKRDGEITAHYVDSVGFKEIPDFLPEQKQEQFERELITESPVIDLPEHWLHVDLAEVRSVTFDITDVAARGAEEELYRTTREFSYDPESKHIMMAEVSNDLFDTGHETPVKHEDAIAEIKGILAQYHDNLDVTIRYEDGRTEQFVPVQPKSETAQDTEKIYQIVTFSHDSGTDDKKEYATMDEAVEAGRQYLADGWDGFAILNTAEHRVELYEGDFPLEGVFSEQVYQNSGEWHRVQATPNLMQPVEEKTNNIHEFAELFGLDEDMLRELVETDPATLNRYGVDRFPLLLEKVRDTRDMDKVKAYFEEKEGAELSTLRLNAKLNKALRDFVQNGTMPEQLETVTAEQTVETSEQTPHNAAILKEGDIVTFPDRDGEWRVTEVSGLQISFENTDENASERSFSHIDFGANRENLQEVLGYVIVTQDAPDNAEQKPETAADTKTSLMSDAAEIKNTAKPAEIKPVTLEFAGEPEQIAEIQDLAFSLGATTSMIDNAKGTISIDTFENHKEELEQAAIELGIKKITPVEQQTVSAPAERKQLTRPERLYRQFTKMFPDVISGEHSHERYGNLGDAYEPLSVEHLGGNGYSLMTYYEQNGDLMRDPDFTFTLDHEAKMLTIREYQQDGVPAIGTVYQCVHDENGNPDRKLLAALEQNFAQVLRNIEQANRPLTAYTDSEGEVTKLDAAVSEPAVETSEPEEISTDKTPELRETLNAFSEKHGLGELNVEARNSYSWTLTETMQDGTEFELGEIQNPDSDIPFTSENLRIALETFEKQTEYRNQEVSELYGRKQIAERHGGVSALPKVRQNLPEISYAGSPSEKIFDNIAAIREMKSLERAAEENRNPYTKWHTKEESEMTLRKYCGWGGLPQVFDERFKRYERERKILQELLTPEEYAAARASTLDAHYTPQIIIDAMYKAVRNMDLPRDARILEPSCGTGNFITRMPAALSDAEVVGVELDNITARIAKQLHKNNPNVSIMQCGFENSGLTNNSFDLAIGNVPFGSTTLDDPDYTDDWLIHDAFFRKALDKVAAGGVVAFCTSSGTLDKANSKVREYLATQAELIGAIRLPNTAFADAGTKVTSDIIFLKKREHPLQAHEPKPDWCYTIPNADGLKINSYFVQNPQMVLGKMEKTSHFDMLTCKPHEGADLKVQLDEAIKGLNATISVTKREKAIERQRGMIEPWGRNFSYQVQDGKAYYRETDTMTEVKCSKKQLKRLEMLCEMRDITRKLLDTQKTSVGDEALQPLRERLNEVYDAYKKTYGTFAARSIKQLFGADADYTIVQSLETKDGEKADIFSKRTVNPNVEITAVQTAEEALQVSLDRRGCPDLIYMATLLREQYPDAELPEIVDKVCTELLDKGAIFIDPEKALLNKPYSGIVERSEYLSGNVRKKHTLALEYAKVDPQFERNAAALEKVIPEDIRAEEISVRLGCTWIDAEDYTKFLQHLSGRPSYSRANDVIFTEATGEYSILHAGATKNLNLAESTTYGTADFTMYELAQKILNQRRIFVQKSMPHPTEPDKVIRRTDTKATKLALEKAKLIREEFQKWIFADPARKAKYERRYNDIFNSLVGREYDGSRLTFAGMSEGFQLRPHQRDCVARAIYGGNTLAAHVVGAGKSAVMFTTVMKKKELGLINKACVVVPKPLVEQVASEWRKLYPDAKLLTVTTDDLNKEDKRKLFTARVATGSYDAVIMSVQQFEKIAMSREYRMNYMQQQLDALEDMLLSRKRDSNGLPDVSVKKIESAKKSLEKRIKKLTDAKTAAKAKDDLLEFEQLGFDYLVCDEAHTYKNGFVTTKMTNVAGVTTNPSGRAEDMHMKTSYFNEEFGQGHILFCTGTPVSNSMTELYVMTRYLRPDLLEQAGVARFDDWAATFGNVVTRNAQAADGKLKLRTSFASFANLPELMAMYKEFADIQSADKLQLPRPALKTGKPQIVSIPATPEQKAYVKQLATRAEAIASGAVDPHDDNMLKITGEARLIGLGNESIEALYAKREEELPFDFVTDGEDSKVDACIRNVMEIYQRTEDTRGVQIIFSDIAVNADDGNFSVYDYIKKKLIEAGVPEEEIIFAPKADATNRADIFRDINEAKYRVVIASTGTLGTGANIQKNLYALHHVDVPWKPSDFEQREGRILRQGNNYDEVEIFNYVTEGTLDSYLYQTVTDKARFIAQLLDDKCPARVSEDCDEKVLTFGEIQAAAEGNPDFKRRIELKNEIAELTMLQTEYAHETGQMQRKIETIPDAIAARQERLEHIRTDKTKAAGISELVLRSQNGNTLIDRKAINDLLISMAKKIAENPDANVPSVSINGFEVSVRAEDHLALGVEVYFTIRGEHSYTCAAGTAENQDNYQRICNAFTKGIAKSEADTVAAIAELETNLEQAKQRVEIPFPHEAELEKKIEDLQQIEEKLAGISVQEDEVCDADEDDIVESASEAEKRKQVYNVDDDDYQPIPEDDAEQPPTLPPTRK